MKVLAVWSVLVNTMMDHGQFRGTLTNSFMQHTFLDKTNTGECCWMFPTFAKKHASSAKM